MRRVTVCLSALFLFLVSFTPNALAILTEDKLLASDGTSGDYFGQSVSISGNSAIVGADGADPEGDLSGAAYIYELQGNSWVEQQKLIASDGAASNHFGLSVSISGNNAIVGAYYGDGNVADSGAAYIYHYDGSSWVEQQKLIASDGAIYDRFGDSVSIFGDYAIVGAYSGDGNVAGSGAAYIYHYDGSSWVEQQKLIASDGTAANQFGKSVSISSNYAIVGASSDNDLGNVSGSAYIFYYDGVNWLEVQKLTASDGAANNQFGTSVSISGNYAIIGSTYGEGFVTDSGAAYIYFFDGSSWVEQQKLFAYNEEYQSFFGITVSIEGDNAIVGARKFNGTGNGLGAAYIFHYDGSSWLAAEMLSASDGADGDYLGNSVSIFGNKALAGAYFDDDNGALSGSAFVFTDYSTDLVSYDPDNDGYDWDVDCNNSDDSFYPGAVEVCGDGQDNDCDDLTDPNDPDCTQEADVDNDGYGVSVDCNDNDPAINPGASEDSYELCSDGEDNNCNDLTDINELACQVDIDGDGYVLADDCDDYYSDVNPGMPDEDSFETCSDYKDNDCDGLEDIMEMACNVDNDIDGFFLDSDCNDSDPAINISATEICDDGVDNDCDFKVDSRDFDCPDDGDGDGYDITVDCNDNDASVNPGATEVCDDGIDNDCNSLTDANDPVCASGSTCTDIQDKGTCNADLNCEWSGNPKNGSCQDAVVCVLDETPETTCTDGIDNDCDGMTDCADTADCGGDPACQGGSCDSYTDKGTCTDDPNCEWLGSPKSGTCQDATVCVPDQTPEATCTDGVDNDCDGMTDCADTADCGGDPACQGGSCDTYTDKTSCQSNGCTWNNKDKVCM
jgi:hypothetical protein